jgi:hypothetical protein
MGLAKTSTTKGTKATKEKPENEGLRGTLCPSWFRGFETHRRLPLPSTDSV